MLTKIRRVRRPSGDPSKSKPKVGRGEYIHAPRLRDKAVNPRWQMNALINNPSNAAAAGAIGVGGGMLATHKKKVEKRDKRRDAEAGALVGGGAGHLSRVGASYGSKAVAERQFAPLTTKGNYGPYAEGPHKPLLNKYKREAHSGGGGSVRAKAKYFDEHFPKGVPSYRARKVGVLLESKAGRLTAVAGGAAVGAATLNHKRVKKNDTTSAFGVDHG